MLLKQIRCTHCIDPNQTPLFFCCCRGHFCGHFTELCPRMYLPNYANRSFVLLCIILECSRKANKTGKNTTHTLYPGCNIFLHRRSETSSHVSYLFGRTLCWKLCHFSTKKTLRSRLYSGNSLIDGDSILVELPCVCSAPYFVKAGFVSLLSPDDT